MVEVKPIEFAIEMPLTVLIGLLKCRVINVETTGHNFEVEGRALEKKFDTNLKPNETRNLPAGTYTVSYPVDDYKERSMQLELTVAQQESRQIWWL